MLNIQEGRVVLCIRNFGSFSQYCV